MTTYSNGTGVVSVENNGSFNAYSGTVNIPDSVPYQGKYYPVTCIGYQAFKDCTGLTVVTLDEALNVPGGTHTLTWSYSKDGSVNPVGDYFAVDNVSLGMRGDVNGNGTVDINDVTALIQYVLTGSTTGINLSNADVNGNGPVDINDVTALIQYVLTGAFPS